MKAVYIERHGGPEVLTYGDRPDPVIRPNEVKVRVRAAALNRLDMWTRLGRRGQAKPVPPPLILGGDCAGDIVEVGPEVSGLRVGDRVMVNPRITCQQCSACLSRRDDLCPHSSFMGTDIDGSYAEYVSVPVINALRIADTVSYEEASAVPTTFLPVWNMLLRQTQLKAWETVLVLSASAGVGTAAIQVAKNLIGARVIATTSTAEKAAKAKELGADEVINYKEEDITQRAKTLTDGVGVDVVVDHVGAEFFNKAFDSLRTGGRYGICGATTGVRAEIQLGALFFKKLQMFGVYMGTKEDLREIVAMLNRGKIRPVIDQVFPLSQARQAHQAMEEHNFFGKLLLKP